MKKLALGLLIFILAGILYYFTFGSSQIADEMKKQLNQELIVLSTHGIAIEERKVEEKKEHFVLLVDNPKKIATYLTTQGVKVSKSDLQLVKGLKLGMDVYYLPDAYSAVSLDIYPLTLPSALSASITQEDAKVSSQLQTLLEKKTLLIHIDINKLGTSFKGSIKDIDVEIQGEKVAKLLLKGSTFSGELEDKKLHQIKQSLKQLQMNLGDIFVLSLKGITSDYITLKNTANNYETHYTVDTIDITKNAQFKILLKTIVASSQTTIKDGLASTQTSSSSKEIKLLEKGKKIAFSDAKFDMKIDNLDFKVFEKLQQINLRDNNDSEKLLQQLVSNGLHVEIPTFSVDGLTYAGKTMEGFNLSSILDIDKSLIIAKVKSHPMSAIKLIDANLKVELSKELLSLIAKQPKAMLALMLFKPEDINGKKVYSLELKDGKFTVNGKSVL